MKKIPTIFLRNPEKLSDVLAERNPAKVFRARSDRNSYQETEVYSMNKMNKDNAANMAPVQKKRILAIRDFVVIAPDSELKTMPGSLIVIPDVAGDENNPLGGIVLSVGCGLVEGGQIIPLKVKVGDHVTFPRNAGTLFKNHPVVEDCFILRENQIFGVSE